MSDRTRRLLWYGMLLFVLGLFVGLAVPAFTNPRMGLAAHLEGVLNGILLLVLGLAWREVRLPPRWDDAAYRLALFGTFGNFAMNVVAAAFGTAALTPIASGSHVGEPWQELLVTVGLVGTGLATLVAAIALLVGFRRQR